MSGEQIPAIVAAVVHARAGRDWRRQLARVLDGEHFGLAAALREEATWVLRHLGYSDAVAAQALGVGVVAIWRGRVRLRARMAEDARLRAWFEAVLAPDEAAARTEAA